MDDTDAPEVRELPVDLEEIATFASESPAYLDDSYERTGYVDTHTGEVHIIYLDAFRCAEGELDPEELSEWSAPDVELAGDILADCGRRYVRIERWDSSEAYELMEAFAHAVCDPRARHTLLYALGGKKPFRRFSDAICEWPALREKWFLFRDHAQRDRARVWLRQFGIEAIDTSPHKLRPAPERW